MSIASEAWLGIATLRRLPVRSLYIAGYLVKLAAVYGCACMCL